MSYVGWNINGPCTSGCKYILGLEGRIGDHCTALLAVKQYNRNRLGFYLNIYHLIKDMTGIKQTSKEKKYIQIIIYICIYKI